MTARRSRPRFPLITKARRAVALITLDWVRHRVSLDLVTSRDALVAAEEALRVVGPYDRPGQQERVINLRRAVAGYAEELAYLDAKAAMLRETDGECPCAAGELDEPDTRAAA